MFANGHNFKNECKYVIKFKMTKTMIYQNNLINIGIKLSHIWVRIINNFNNLKGII